MSGILNAIEISSRGLSVQRAKMNAVAENMANAETTETPEGGPYRRRRVVVKAEPSGEGFGTQLRRATGALERTHPGHRPGRPVRIRRETDLQTVEARETVDKESNFKLLYDPTHPDADENGYVKMPDIDVIEEMVNMMAASRGYEANTVAISAAKKMATDALDI